MNWKGRVASATLDGLWTIGLKTPAKKCARAAGIDPETIGHTWRGVALSCGEVETILKESGEASCGFRGANTPMAWCVGEKRCRNIRADTGD